MKFQYICPAFQLQVDIPAITPVFLHGAFFVREVDGFIQRDDIVDTSVFSARAGVRVVGHHGLIPLVVDRHILASVVVNSGLWRTMMGHQIKKGAQGPLSILVIMIAARTTATRTIAATSNKTDGHEDRRSLNRTPVENHRAWVGLHRRR